MVAPAELAVVVPMDEVGPVDEDAPVDEPAIPTAVLPEPDELITEYGQEHVH